MALVRTPVASLRPAIAVTAGADQVLIVYSHGAVDRAIVDSALRVVSGETVLKTRTAEWTPDNRAVVLYLLAPHKAPPRRQL